MTFAWYGFQLELPDDWAPTAMSGRRSEGYVRFGSPGPIGFQIRWRNARHGADLADRLLPYFDRLQRDARKRRLPFESSVHEEDGRVAYRYRGVLNGRGVILHSEAQSRVFFMEAVAEKTASLDARLRDALRSFQLGDADTERWSVLGANALTPVGLDVQRRTFLAGRTTLDLAHRQAKVRIERWGFADQLLAKHRLEEWARAALNMPRADTRLTSGGAHLEQRPRLGTPIVAEVVVDDQLNQIRAVRTVTRRDEWRPTCVWLS